jgi:O-antigen ligase
MAEHDSDDNALPSENLVPAAPGSRSAGSGVRRVPAKAAPSWNRLALAGLPLICVALGGGTARWSQGVTLLLLGGLLLAAPPRASAGRGLNAILAGLLLLASAAFLPARWFFWPDWRGALTEDFGLTLPATLSLQPWLSAENLMLFLAGVSWFYLMWTTGWTPEQKIRTARFYALGVAVLAGVFALLYELGVVVPIWPTERHFGPFPNRNQTADFLAVGALVILACAHLRWRLGRKAAALGWGISWMVTAFAVFLSFSRAGVAMLFIGAAGYLGIEARRAAQRHPAKGAASARRRRTALAATAVLGLLSAFLLFGGETLERFRPASAAAPVTAVTTEFRLRIQGDAADFVRASPWCGVGLGNFSGVFPIFRHRSALPARAIHPESDYLWIAAELGWPALALALAGLALVGRKLWKPPGGPDRPLRWAAILALSAFVLHGLVDVSAHRLGTVFSALFVLALALPPGPIHPAARWPAAIFRALGLVFIGVGAIWILNALGALPPLPGRQGVDHLKEQANRDAAHRDYGAVRRSASRALEWAPLDWTLYFARASALIQEGAAIDDALADFRRARYLEPFIADVPLSEAKLWLAAGQGGYAINALAEACRREPAHAEGYIGDFFRAAKPGHAALIEQLSALTRNDPALDLPFLEQIVPPESVRQIAERLAADPDLRRLDDAQKTRFFRIWAQRGDPRALAAQMAGRPDWQKLGWRWWADALARGGDEREACAVAARFAPSPNLPPKPDATRTPAELLSDSNRAPGDPFLSLQLYFARSTLGNSAVLSAIRKTTARPGCPRYFYRLDAELSAENGEWRRAWEAWQRYLQTP